MAPKTAKTRAEKRTAFTEFIRSIFDSGDNSGLERAILRCVDNIPDLLTLDLSDIANLQYEDEANAGQLLDIMLGHKTRVCALQVLCIQRENNGDSVMPDDIAKLTSKELERFLMSAAWHYHSIGSPIIPTTRSGLTIPTSSGTAPTTSTTQLKSLLTAADTFRKGIKRDQSLFPECKKDEEWDKWSQRLSTQVCAQAIISKSQPSQPPGGSRPEQRNHSRGRVHHSVNLHNVSTAESLEDYLLAPDSSTLSFDRETYTDSNEDVDDDNNLLPYTDSNEELDDDSNLLETFIASKEVYKFKLWKDTGPIEYHLGCNFIRDEDRTLRMELRKYIDKMIGNYERMFGMKPKGRSGMSPLEKGDQSELNTSEFLDDNDIVKYQSVIRSLQWAVTLARFDIATESAKSKEKSVSISNLEIIYIVSGRNMTKPSKDTVLGDRGANGSVCGKEMSVIDTGITLPTVHVRGFDKHEQRDIPLVAAEGVMQTNKKGPVIHIVSFAAHIPQHNTILSCIQTEHYGCDVNDKSVKVKGGLQGIITKEGYVIPFNLRGGLPCIQMRPFTDKEWGTTPHMFRIALKGEDTTQDFRPRQDLYRVLESLVISGDPSGDSYKTLALLGDLYNGSQQQDRNFVWTNQLLGSVHTLYVPGYTSLSEQEWSPILLLVKRYGSDTGNMTLGHNNFGGGADVNFTYSSMVHNKKDISTHTRGEQACPRSGAYIRDIILSARAPKLRPSLPSSSSEDMLESYQHNALKGEETDQLTHALEELGHSIGISPNVGHQMMTYKVLTDDTKKAIYRSQLRLTLRATALNLRLDPLKGEEPRIHKVACKS